MSGAAIALPALANETRTNALAAKLATALRSIGGPVCNDAAQRLEATAPDARNISLHLRRADLTKSDTFVLAHALQSLTGREAAALGSFSMSYNPDMEDAGALALARALPRTIREVGLVGCDLGDEGGSALIEWAATATGLQMICVEDNKFSGRVKSQFRALATGDANLMVIV